MFVTLTRFDTVTRIIVEIVGVVLLACVVLGFKTRLSCVMLFILLNIENLTLNVSLEGPRRHPPQRNPSRRPLVVKGPAHLPPQSNLPTVCVCSQP